MSLYLKNSEKLIAYRVEQGQQTPAISSPDTSVLNNGSPTAHTMTTGQPSRIEDRDTETVFSVEHLDRRSHSEFATPVLLGDRVIGSLTIESDRAYGFGAEDLFAIQTLSDLIALAVESARLLGQSDRRLSELAALINLGHAITSVLDQQKVSQLILDGAAGLTDADYAGLFLIKSQ